MTIFQTSILFKHIIFITGTPWSGGPGAIAPMKLLTLISLKSDVKPEKFDCEKTELSGITDRSQIQQSPDD